MSNLQVAATTITNIGGGHRKFYTIHVLNDLEIRQWGRIGTTGQFQHILHGGKRAAEESAEKQLRKKESGGYGDRQNVVYALDEGFLSRCSEKELSRIVSSTHLAAQAGEAGQLPPSPEQEADLDREDYASGVAVAFDSFNERALNVISSAASGGAEAATTYATLRDEFGGMEEGFERCKSLLETLEIMLTNSEEVA